MVKKPTKLGRRLLKYMKIRGLSNKEMGLLWGYSRSGIHNICFGVKNPSYRQLKKLIKISDGFFEGNDFF